MIHPVHMHTDMWNASNVVSILLYFNVQFPVIPFSITAIHDTEVHGGMCTMAKCLMSEPYLQDLLHEIECTCYVWYWWCYNNGTIDVIIYSSHNIMDSVQFGA